MCNYQPINHGNFYGLTINGLYSFRRKSGGVLKMTPTQEKALLLVRLLSMKGLNTEIRKCMISEQQSSICDFIKNKLGATSSEVAKEFDIAKDNASIILARLYFRSFLTRGNKRDSGHHEFTYKFALN